ncbi:hypothetical protein KIW84_062070 [Lathyrus oleraceus]|uniref:Uncharacterized protein n=1 Tax=Pisum sativum TaxID=3888 RepID=A0A9D5A356_PEA|nr:hypothetical protein KIW84_062070 [Pisum sativum]
MNDLSIADERNVGINMVEVTQGDQAEVGEDRRRKEYQRLAYPKEEENLIEFIKRCQNMRTEVMLFPRCNAIFDRKAATNLEAVDKAKRKENWGTVRYDPRRGRGMVKFVTKGLEVFPIGGGVPTGICCALTDGLGAFCEIETAGIDPVDEGIASDIGTDPTLPLVEGIGLDTSMASLGLGLFGLFG